MQSSVCRRLFPPLKVLLDDDHHKVVCNNRIVALSPAEYRLVHALWQQRERSWQSDGRVPPLISIRALAQTADVPVAQVQRLISRANQKLAAHALLVISIRTYGYELRHFSEVQ